MDSSKQNEIRVDRDGNGGWNFVGNVQKAILFRYGPIALLLMLVAMSFINALGAQLWRTVVKGETTTYRVDIVEKRLDSLLQEQQSLRLEVKGVQTELRALRLAIQNDRAHNDGS